MLVAYYIGTWVATYFFRKEFEYLQEIDCFVYLDAKKNSTYTHPSFTKLKKWRFREGWFTAMTYDTHKEEKFEKEFKTILKLPICRLFGKSIKYSKSLICKSHPWRLNVYIYTFFTLGTVSRVFLTFANEMRNWIESHAESRQTIMFERRRLCCLFRKNCSWIA